MIFVGLLLGLAALLGLLLSIRPCMNMCRRMRLSVAMKLKEQDRRSRGNTNGVPRGRDNTEGVRLMELPGKNS
jgi:hypothetical protein